MMIQVNVVTKFSRKFTLCIKQVLLLGSKIRHTTKADFSF